MLDPHRVEGAAGRFRAFFDELNDTFLEREDVLRQVSMALLCKEHALITGPPGTAKSALATGVFGRIVCEESGAPSIYSRQITESTVQTDLIGPIDFKNLMETGRTEHFTDEGMLGAIHSFLDEVFDGRDMLLRSALNVLQERELKQGTKIVRGRIEVALMTSNRYIADVLEHARETLLAFVDRIAFVSFVPRSFADPKNMKRVLDRHVARSSHSKLDALLTIQDVDVLQALTQEVVVSEAICQSLAALLSGLNEELNAAVRADPKFVPTRYLSTRTAVRCGKVLRAAVAYDKIFNDPDRVMQVLPKDLEALRLHLLLGGPAPDDVEVLLSRETEPNERRQLEILRTEREIFNRCLSRLPKVKVPRLKKKKKPKKKKADGKASVDKKAASKLDALELEIATGKVPQLVAAIRELTRVAAGDQDAPHAQRLLDDAVRRLNDAAVRAALDSSMSDQPLLEAVEQLVVLVNEIDDSISMHGIAKWLRGRAVEMINEVARYGVGAWGTDLKVATDEKATRQDAMDHTNRRLTTLERLNHLRGLAQGAEAPHDSVDDLWLDAVEVVEDGVAALWDATFCRAAEDLLASQPNVPLPDVLAAIEGELTWLDDLATRFAKVRGGSTTLKAKAIGARLTDLVASLMRRVDAVDRRTLHEEIEGVMKLLAKAKLADTIKPDDWLLWATNALVRSADVAVMEVDEYNHDGYRELRGDEQRTAVAYTLGEVALRVSTTVDSPGLGTVADLLTRLPDELRDSAAEIDLARIERATSYIEGWWQHLSAGNMPAKKRLDIVVKSRIFDVLWDESALARFALETRLIADLMPDLGDRTVALRGRLEALEAATRRGAHALLRSRTDSAWEAAIGKDA